MIPFDPGAFTWTGDGGGGGGGGGEDPPTTTPPGAAASGDRGRRIASVLKKRHGTGMGVKRGRN